MEREVYDIPITTLNMLYKGRRGFDVGEYLLVVTSLYFGRISPVFTVLESCYEADDMCRRREHYEDIDLFGCAEGWSYYVNGYEVWHVVENPNDLVYKVVGFVGDQECMRANFNSLNDSRVFARRSVGYPFDRVSIFASNKYLFGSRSLVFEYYCGSTRIKEICCLAGCGV